MDGALVRAWASHKSFQPKDGPPSPSPGPRSNPEVSFKGDGRTNGTHRSPTDPDAKLYTKSPKAGAIPGYMGHAHTENRNGLAVDEPLTQASGRAEREAALEMLREPPGEVRKSVGADKACDTEPFAACRSSSRWRPTHKRPRCAQRSAKRRKKPPDRRQTVRSGECTSAIGLFRTAAPLRNRRISTNC